MVVHIYNSSTQDVEAGGIELNVMCLHGEFKASLTDMSQK